MFHDPFKNSNDDLEKKECESILDLGVSSISSI